MILAKQTFSIAYDSKIYEKVFLYKKLSIKNEIYHDSYFWINYLKFKKDLSTKDRLNNENGKRNYKELINLLNNLCDAGLEKTLVIQVLQEIINYYNIPMKDSDILKVYIFFIFLKYFSRRTF